MAFAQARNVRQLVLRGTAKMGSAAVLLLCTLVVPYALPYNECENPVFYTQERSVAKVCLAAGLLCFDALELTLTLRALGHSGAPSSRPRPSTDAGAAATGFSDAPVHPRNRRFVNAALAQLTTGPSLLCYVGALFFSYAFYLTVPLTKLRGVQYGDEKD